jgi:O-antigen/teichoic acid export membrane protein
MLVLGGLGVLNRQLDVVMMKGLATDAETGVYAVAVQLSTFISMVLTSLNLVIAPRFASLHAAGRIGELQRLVATSAAIVTAGTVPIAVGLVAMSPWLLPFWGPEFVDARLPFAILALGNVVNALSGSVGYLLIMSGNERTVARVFAAVAAVNIAANLVLIPRMGAAGAATATAVSMALWNLTLIVLVRRRLGIHSTVFAWLYRSRWASNRQ